MWFQFLTLTAGNFAEVVRRAPGQGLPSRQTVSELERMRTAETVLCQLAAVTPDGEMVGYGLAVTGPWDPILRPGHFEVRVRVGAPWRRRGVGGAIYRELERFARAHGAVALEGCVADDQPADLAWAEHRGFAAVQHVYPSELDLACYDPAPFAGVLERLEAGGLRLTSLAEYPQTDEWFERFVDFYWELGEDVPGMSGRTRPALVRMKALLSPWEPGAAILVADRERWVAMCLLLPQDWGYYNQMAGVRPEYRGRGIGLAVKLAAVAYARGRGARLMRTHNDSTNAPMLAVNRKLGFQAQPGLYWLKRE